jgi:hypothetical protein
MIFTPLLFIAESEILNRCAPLFHGAPWIFRFIFEENYGRDNLSWATSFGGPA